MIDDYSPVLKTPHAYCYCEKQDNKILGMVTMDDVLEELVEDISEPSH